MKAIAAYQGKIAIMEKQQTQLPAGHLKVRTQYSAVSPGTELTMLKLSEQREDPLFIGYSAMGEVIAVGSDTDSAWLGKRVACYGAPYVHHGQILHVPTNLAAVVPEHVAGQEAAFAGLGAIGIHALRTARLQFGETVLIVGLGISGNIIAQVANSAGYETAAIDINEQRAAALKSCGVQHVFTSDEQLDHHLNHITAGNGIDAVLLCTGGAGQLFIDKALERIRLGGKVVIVGDIAPNFSRDKMFAKEASVLISRAGGPGRYDAQYERGNIDYPLSFVRWTEGRNTAEFIRLLAKGCISLQQAITHQIDFAGVAEGFSEHVCSGKALGTVIKYSPSLNE